MNDWLLSYISVSIDPCCLRHIEMVGSGIVSALLF